MGETAELSSGDRSDAGGSGHGSETEVRTSVVLPVYNERENLRPLVDEILEVFELPEMARYTPFEVLLVDDGSSDGSRDVSRSLSEASESVTAIHLRRNFGQSAALAAGIDHAAGEYVVTLDADGQNNPADIPKLLDRLTEGYGCVSGWRRDRKDSIAKRLPSKIQTRLAKLTGPDIHDFGCTLKAYSREALRDIDLHGEGHRYIPAKLHRLGYAITEEPVDHRDRLHGTTKYGWRRLLKGFVDLLFHIFWNRYSTRPLHLLGGLGFLCLLVGALIGSHAVFIKFAFGIELIPRLPRLLLTAVLLVFGLQLIMFGFLSEMIIHSYYSEREPYRIERIE